MIIRPLRPAACLVLKPKLIHFAKKYGEDRITKSSLNYFHNLRGTDLTVPGTQVLIAAENNQLAGMSFLANYGKSASIIVVSPDYQGRGIAKQLLQTHIESLHAIYCQVAQDNLACMNACIQAGLRPIQFLTGPTGKPSLIFSNEREAVEWQHQY